MITKAYSATLFYSKINSKVSQLDEANATEKFTAALDAHFGTAENVAAAYSAYSLIAFAHEEDESIAFSPKKQKQIRAWIDAERIAKSAAFEDWARVLPDTGFDIKINLQAARVATK